MDPFVNKMLNTLKEARNREPLGPFYPEFDVDQAAIQVFGLMVLLTRNNIEYTVDVHLGGWIIKFSDVKGSADAILNNGSYGHEDCLFETTGLIDDEGDVTGFLSPEEVVDSVIRTLASQV